MSVEMRFRDTAVRLPARAEEEEAAGLQHGVVLALFWVGLSCSKVERVRTLAVSLSAHR